MERGIVGNIFTDYTKMGDRELNVTLLRSLDIWLDIADSEEFNQIGDFKSYLEKQILQYCYREDEFQRYPIYFISTRPKTRIIKTKKQNFGLDTELVFKIKEKAYTKKLKVSIQTLADFLKVKPKEITDVFFFENGVICKYQNKNGSVISVYDLLHLISYKFKYSNKIFYIGHTKNPDKRPLNGNHAGLNSILRKDFNKNDDDLFINYNQFHVNSLSNYGGLMVHASNTILNEINIKTEAELIEFSLIEFYIPGKRKNYKSELGALKNFFVNDLKKKQISKLLFNIDYSGAGAMFRYSNQKKEKQDKINFEVSMENEQVTIK
ncbi:MAG: hypothetical protein GY756_25495 [bacterium]|nr:hypothetical protein [bacterium]